MTRCYVCNAEPQDGCQAIGGEMAECPRPARMTEDDIHASDWWCPHCRKEVPPEMVTKDGEHYLEGGGCGRPVRGEPTKAPRTILRARNLNQTEQE